MKKILFGLMLVCAAAFAVVAVEKTVGTGASFKGPVGLQLWSLRDSFKKDVPGTLDLVKKLGFKYVETAGTYGKSAADLKMMLDERGLTAIGGHFGFDAFEKDPEAVAKDAVALGLKFAGTAWIPHKDGFDMDECKHAAEVFNKAGEVLAKHGIRFYYHTHGYEFQPHGEGTLFDELVTSTKPEFVSYQMDVTWVVHPGQDPAKLLLKYPNRWALMHIKDLKKGVAHNLSGGTDKENDVCVGTGQTDWVAVMKAAQQVGVKWYFIEDESSSVVSQVPCSLGYLEKLEF